MLFEPITIQGMNLGNRIVYPACQMNMGITNRRAMAFYGERARGGVGLVIAGVAVDYMACEETWGSAEQLASFLGRLRLFTDHIHEAGARIGVQLWHGNRFPAGRGDARLQQPLGMETRWKEKEYVGGDRVAPSARDDMRELTIPEIESIIYRFAKASRNVRGAGFDCVELHGAHGYLPCQFTLPAWNRRTDKYGGDLAGRMRFGIDLVTAVRAWVGPDFPILFRLGVMDLNHSAHPDSIAYARGLGKAGVNCLNVSVTGERDPGKEPTLPGSPPKQFKMGTYAYLAEPIKRNVSIPVITVGRINMPEVAEEILTGHQADMVAIGRQLIADPLWPQKVREGRQGDIVACTSCNINCFTPTRQRNLPEGSPLCKVNSRVGKEWEDVAR